MMMVVKDAMPPEIAKLVRALARQAAREDHEAASKQFAGVYLSAIDYAKQKTFEALYSLVGDAPIQQRLACAGLPLATLERPDELPAQVASRLAAILDALTAQRTKDVEAGAATLSDEDAVRLAREILELHVEVMGGI